MLGIGLFHQLKLKPRWEIDSMFHLKTLFINTFCVAFFGVILPAFADHVKSSKPVPGHGARLVMPIMNPARGMKIFVD